MFTLKSVLYDDRIEKWQIRDEPVYHHILIFVSGGKVIYQVKEEVLELHEGDVLFIPSGTIRSCQNDAKGPHQKYSAHFTASGEAEAALDVLREHVVFKWSMHNANYFRQRFSMLLMQWFDQVHGGHLICQGILLELVGRLIHDARHKHSSAVKKDLINRLQNYIVHNHCKPIQLSDLAHHIDRSPNHVTRIFKEMLGQTPIDYIHQVKVSVACELLKGGGMTIAEISDHLGYCEQSYFHRIFKKFTGVAPTAVQKGHSIAFVPLPGLSAAARKEAAKNGRT
ncbi:helix-turn-helix transcriptional regulator [Paenibacillus hemerocallicola]|uniref:Helix-turn-helix transcriptional regulator n=1 Tax=Paenibacillus hemerocallicola TaxID=1172614 RepID=A0A5C4TFK8_9BACL|nr:helix-turn-helix domain-containing protein [Paenibacillus hemerocallicola]TNJ67821.1 helix-turn-helix transcriptional regulator [Paenibacillus hemerocallicola]